VAELVSHLGAEHPEDRAAAPKVTPADPVAACRASQPPPGLPSHHPAPHPLQKLEDWSRLYIRYVQTFRKLCAAHDGVAQPQKRRCLRRTLEACLGRLLELRGWLAQLNAGVDVIDLEGQLAALQLTPEALDLPVPAYFQEERAGQLAARAAAAAAALAAEAAAAPGAATAGGVGERGAAEAGGAEAGAAASDAESDSKAEAGAEDGQELAGVATATTTALAAAPILPGSAAGTAHAAHSSPPKQPQEQPAISEEERARRVTAAVALQAGARGWLARRSAARQRRQELEFLGMLPPADGRRSAALQRQLAAIAGERKARQAQRQAELDSATVSVKAGLRQREGFGMKEAIRDKVRQWRCGAASLVPGLLRVLTAGTPAALQCSLPPPRPPQPPHLLTSTYPCMPPAAGLLAPEQPRPGERRVC
jgi:hypothetical protein